MSPTIQELREAREKATGAAWGVGEDGFTLHALEDVRAVGKLRVPLFIAEDDPAYTTEQEQRANASFIALAANNWLPMCDEIETLRADKAALTLRLEAAEKALADERERCAKIADDFAAGKDSAIECFTIVKSYADAARHREAKGAAIQIAELIRGVPEDPTLPEPTQ